VVVVAGEMPVVEQDFLEENAVSMGGKLELELGDEVVIDLDLAQIRVTGKTEFAWTNEMIPIANGNFDVSGEIQAYGQFLRVTQGRIGFPGVPADNPHLNIRAEREIFGNSQIRRAGLMVAGTLRRPLIEAYTVPMTNKERAQTLLVTGSDFNFEQGVGAVDVGMYVLPRLYVSYGIGVFEDGNVLKARFDIGRGFGIRATSGQRETGLDVSYTVER
jgi:translocation and assembly module TamB